MVQVRVDVVAQARGQAAAAVEAAVVELAQARAARDEARAAAAAAVVQARVSGVPWIRLRELTGASRQVLTTRIRRALGGQEPVTTPAMPAAVAGQRVAGAWEQEADARAAVTAAAHRLAEAVIVAREAGVPWRIVCTATGTTREAVIAMVRRTQTGDRGDRTPIWDGTAPPVVAREPVGPWRWASVQAAVSTAADRVGDHVRRRLLADEVAPARILEEVRAARVNASVAAAAAVDDADPDDPEAVVAAVWAAAAAWSVDARL